MNPRNIYSDQPVAALGGARDAAVGHDDVSGVVLSVVVPMYKEAARIGATLDDLTATLAGSAARGRWA